VLKNSIRAKKKTRKLEPQKKRTCWKRSSKLVRVAGVRGSFVGVVRLERGPLGDEARRLLALREGARLMGEDWLGGD